MLEAPEALLGIDEIAERPSKTRIRDGAAARGLVSATLQEDNNGRSQQRSVVKGWVDGNPPFNQARRRAANLTWCANLNFMGGKALMDQSGVPYYQIFAGVAQYAECKTNFQPEHPDHERWNSSMSRRLHCLLKRWQGFDWQMQQASYQMRLHGIGPCFFDRADNWRFRSIASGMLLAPQGAPSCIDERMPYLVVRVPYRIHELWRFIQDEESATAAGWNVPAVKNVIKKAARGLTEDGQWSQAPWEKWQTELKNNDLSFSYTKADIIHCAHVVNHENSTGKCSQFIVSETPVEDYSAGGTGNPPAESFLFASPNSFDHLGQVVIAFFQDIGDGTWHSVRGLAATAYHSGVEQNKLLNRILDGVYIDSSLILKSLNSQSSDKMQMQIQQFGPVTWLGSGVEIQQNKLSGAIEGPMGVFRLLQNNMASNIGQSGSRSLSREDGRGEQPTATGVNAQVQKEATLSQGQMTLFYETLDRLYAEMFRRAADPNTSDEEARRFQRECKEDGVPAKALQDMEYVRANRESGYGSPQMRQLVLQQVQQIVPMLPEEGRTNFLDMYISATAGVDKINLLNPREHIPDSDDAIAAMENAMFGLGREPIITSEQNDVIHLHSHLKDAADTLTPLNEALESGQTEPTALDDAYRYVQTLAPHVDAHIARLRRDPSRKQMASMFAQQLQAIVSFSGKLRGAIIEAQRAQQLAAAQDEQATALGALDEARVRSVDTQTQLAASKVQSQISNQHLKTMNALRLSQLKTAESIRQARAKEFQESLAA